MYNCITWRASNSESIGLSKSKKKKPLPVEDEEEDESDEEEDGNDVLKTFLESVVNLVREVRPAKKKKKKEAATDLMKSLRNLLN